VVHAAVFCNERSSAFFVTNMTIFGIQQMLRVSCFVENEVIKS